MPFGEEFSRYLPGIANTLSERIRQKREEDAQRQKEEDYATALSELAQPFAGNLPQGIDPQSYSQAGARAGLTGGQYLETLRSLEPEDRDAYVAAMKEATYRIVVNKERIEDQPELLQPGLREKFGMPEPEGPMQFKGINDVLLHPDEYEAQNGPGSFDALMGRVGQYGAAKRKPDKPGPTADEMIEEKRTQFNEYVNKIMSQMDKTEIGTYTNEEGKEVRGLVPVPYDKRRRLATLQATKDLGFSPEELMSVGRNAPNFLGDLFSGGGQQAPPQGELTPEQMAAEMEAEGITNVDITDPELPAVYRQWKAQQGAELR